MDEPSFTPCKAHTDGTEGLCGSHSGCIGEAFTFDGIKVRLTNLDQPANPQGRDLTLANTCPYKIW